MNTAPEKITPSPLVPEAARIVASTINTAEEATEQEPATARVTNEPEENTTLDEAPAKQTLTDSTIFSSEIFIQKITI